MGRFLSYYLLYIYIYIYIYIYCIYIVYIYIYILYMKNVVAFYWTTYIPHVQSSGTDVHEYSYIEILKRLL